MFLYISIFGKKIYDTLSDSLLFLLKHIFSSFPYLHTQTYTLTSNIHIEKLTSILKSDVTQNYLYKPLPLIFNNFSPRFLRFQARIEMLYIQNVLYFWHKHPFSHFFRYFQNNQISVNPKTRCTSGCYNIVIPLITKIVQTTVSSLT